MNAAAAGAVVGVGSEWPEMQPSKREWIVVSLNLRPGNSGGPLVDGHDRLVRINTVMTGPEVGMAVPAHVVKAFLAKRWARRVRPANRIHSFPGGRQPPRSPAYS